MHTGYAQFFLLNKMNVPSSKVSAKMKAIGLNPEVLEDPQMLVPVALPIKATRAARQNTVTSPRSPRGRPTLRVDVVRNRSSSSRSRGSRSFSSSQSRSPSRSRSASRSVSRSHSHSRSRSPSPLSEGEEYEEDFEHENHVGKLKFAARLVGRRRRRAQRRAAATERALADDAAAANDGVVADDAAADSKTKHALQVKTATKDEYAPYAIGPTRQLERPSRPRTIRSST